MASSQNLPTIDPWILRPALTDSWFADYFARDADTLTKALHKSLSGVVLPDDNVSPFPNVTPDVTAVTTPTVSSLSGGSDHESAPKRHRTAVAASGKITKRKSRASKRSQTTYITADPTNFRQMVQQVTGVRFGGAGMPMAPAVVKPEPQRAVGVGGGRLPAGAGCLPTLDTSAFLLDHHSQVVGHNGSTTAGPAGLSGPGPISFGTTMGGSVDSHAASSLAGLDFDTFSSFPTLESWKVM
ncbi:hypothetical protein RJT34_21782 [Clitoria ternatea]|uniref:VQ domain-containing protein n=1 Tax=Clitoria ternatea TaxID=43366 RepID=A0AAN9IUQ6_CLITE